MRRGIWYAVGAYTIWGLLPLYWKALHVVPALQLISHRIVWSCLLLAGVILLTRQVGTFRAAVRRPRVVPVYAVAAVLLTVNWTVYVWAVNAGFIVETSLGYFINPLISVLLGVAFLNERLRPGQWLAIGVAASGVAFLTWAYGSLPWIALALAGTFATYGLVKKLAPLGSVHGLALETGLVFVPAAVYLLVAGVREGGGPLLIGGAHTALLLVGTGVATSVPLLLFASAARSIPLLWVGVLQYIAPTLQFLLGVLVYHEPMTAERLVGFAIVWIALAIFGVEGALAHRATLFPATTE